MDNELLLFDRVNIIKDTITKYGEENFYLSFSGGKDSTILHHLLDIALPNNKIPRVFIDTGIEYVAIREFVLDLSKNDDRFVILKPSKPIKQTLDSVGYPFKSKQHSHNIMLYQKHNIEKFKEVKQVIDENTSLLKDYDFIHALPLGVKTLVKYYYGVRERESCISTLTIPKCLKYQLDGWNEFKISDQCCYEMKKKPVHKWEKDNNRKIAITGIRNEEGGTRTMIKGCILTDKDGKVKKFHPLLVVSDDWEDWFIVNQKIQLCKLYRKPYNFKRTGCKGCPFSLELQEQLDTMSIYLPNERKQCEIIWKPVYEEYRRIGFRLKNKMTIWD